MAIPVERFSEAARRVLTLALQESQILNKNYIGVEHLGLAVLENDQSLATRLIKEKSVQPNQVREAIERKFGKGSRLAQGQLSLSPNAKEVLEDLVVKEADNLDQPIIGPDHIFLGLLKEKEGAIAIILADLGINPQELHQQIVQQLEKL